MANLDVLEGRFVSYCPKFCYLGTNVSNDLDDTADIDLRIAKGNAAFQYMKPILRNKLIHPRMRAELYKALVVNVTLWGCDSWAMSKKHLHSLDVFQNRCVRSMTLIFRLQCRNYYRTTQELHELLGLPKLSSMARVRQLRFLEKTVYMPPTRLTRQIIGCQAKRPDGHRFTRGSVTTTQTSYRDALVEAGLCEKGDSGALCKWMLNFKKSDAYDKIDANLGLPPGTYRRGRHCGTRATQNSNVRI